ncbi:hypothetical protein PV10_00225 [Exophiala mesophila]|uniref:Major facilitator superfamily (MFS) profile domain-containing protein n=1 Tax=Exophiala mesophila TaxID=212818 RepID=A0A0D1ZQT8_EXOME|nr:uncharacterized protein PV10_00225 [Exophiala mesophila]KIV96344.1 hypothetical protein PV10_00225 [Exophiala mesophila]
MSIITKFQSWSQQLTPFFIYLLLTATLGPLLFGYHLAELNAPQDVITCVRKSLDTTDFPITSSSLPQCIPMNATQLGLVSSIFTLGGLVGALASGSLSARYGRLLVMRYNTAFLMLGPVAEALSPNILVLSIGRFVSGLGAGTAVVVVPIYISEIAPPREKGFFGAFTQIMTNIGILITQVLGYFLSRGSLWRIILAVAGLIGLLQAVGLAAAVDSPKWNAENGHTSKAKLDLRKIRGAQANIEEEIAGWEAEDHDEEQQTLLSSPDNPPSAQPSSVGIIGVLRSPDHNRAILAVVVVMIAQQLCGINSIVMYGVSLLADLLKSNSALLNILVSLLNIIATTGFAPLADTLGRKPVLLTSIAGMSISSVLLAIGIRAALPLLSAIAVLLFVASFAFALGPIPFILASELVGPEAVGATQSWALAANWIATFIVAQFFPLVNQKLGKGTVYFVFAAIAAVSFVFVGWYVPETKGKKDVDEVWGRHPRRED